MALAGAELLFLQLAALEQIFAARAEKLASERGIALGVLVLFRMMKADFLGLKNPAALLDAAAETAKQGFETFFFFAFDFNHKRYTFLSTKN